MAGRFSGRSIAEAFESFIDKRIQNAPDHCVGCKVWKVLKRGRR